MSEKRSLISVVEPCCRSENL